MKLIILSLLIPFYLIGQTQIGQTITGEAILDRCGRSLQLSADGNVLAVSSPGADPMGLSRAGEVRLFKNESGTWTQIGATLNGVARSNNFGMSLSLSSDGNIVAIGANRFGEDDNNPPLGRGRVAVYQNVNNNWVQIGDDIEGVGRLDRFGYSVSLSGDGKTFAAGALANANTGGRLAGHVRIFTNIGGVWTQVGQDINGENSDDFLGSSVTLSDDGSRVVIGVPGSDAFNEEAGEIKVYENQSGNWVQLGESILGVNKQGQQLGNFDTSTSLSKDGNILAVGSPFSDAGIFSSGGEVKIYTLTNNEWVQLGNTIAGRNEFELIGQSVSLSSDGSLLAVGAPGGSDVIINGGTTRVFQNNSGSWEQVGVDIIGTSQNGNSGISVQMAKDTNIIAVGAPGDALNGAESGSVKVYGFSVLSNQNNPLLHEFEIFPNPASSIVNIKLDEKTTLLKTKIYNAIGQLINTGNQTVINTSELSNGLYFIEIITNKGTATKKVIIN